MKPYAADARASNPILPSPKGPGLLIHLVAIALVLASGGAAAEWVEIGENPTTTLYVDPAVTATSRGTVKMWSLFDYKAKRPLLGSLYSSMRSQDEFDCGNEQTRGLYASWHGGRMGTGTARQTQAHPDSEWMRIPADSGRGLMWAFACAQR